VLRAAQFNNFMTAPHGSVLRINHHFAWRFAYGVAEPPDGRGEMKRALLRVATGSVLVLGMIGATSAADLVVKAPVVAPVPVFSWTGVYLGIGGGSGWGTKEYSWNQDATAAALSQQGNPNFLPPVPYLGNTQGSHPISGGFFGGQIGGNWQIGWAVLGVQADAHWADLNGKGSCFDPGAGLGAAALGVSYNCSAKVSSFGSVTGRLGAAFDRALIYAKGGWAWEQGTLDLNISGVTFALNDPNASITPSSLSQSRSGWTWGAGVEYAFAPNWSAFLEYDYFDFGTKAANSVSTLTNPAVIIAAARTSYAYPIQTDVTEHFQVIKAGVNFRYSWW
jgi:outer membrane immunogenic protein